MAALLIMGYFVAIAGKERKTTREANRASLMAMRDAIEIGDSVEQLHQKFKNLNNRNDLVIRTEGQKAIAIVTPSEFGATNWVLQIELENARVTAVKMRTADGPPPTGGPVDKMEIRK